MPFGWSHDQIQSAFVGTCIVLIAVGLVFHLTASPAWKRRVQPYAAAAVGIVFLTFVELLGGRGAYYFAAIPVAIITYINAKVVKYCPQCGAFNRSPFIFPAPRYCNRCGADLDESPDAGGNQGDLRRR